MADALGDEWWLSEKDVEDTGKFPPLRIFFLFWENNDYSLSLLEFYHKRLKQNGKISGEKVKMSKVIRRTTAVNKWVKSLPNCLCSLAFGYFCSLCSHSLLKTRRMIELPDGTRLQKVILSILPTNRQRIGFIDHFCCTLCIFHWNPVLFLVNKAQWWWSKWIKSKEKEEKV